MSSVTYIIYFLLGTVVGSFLNVIALRYKLGEKLLTASVAWGRSRCPDCKTQLRWYELVPVVSFIIQGGKCRTCKKRLAFQYPVVELLTGFIFLFVPIRLLDVYNIWNVVASGRAVLFFWLVVIWLISLSVLLLILLIDLRLLVIPDQLNLLLGALGIAVIIVQFAYHAFGMIEGSFIGYHALLFGFRGNILVNHIIGALIGGIVFGLIAIIGRGRAMGWGDVKLITVLGLLFGWPDILIIMFLAFVIGALVSLVILITKKRTLKDVIPFGPFITIAAAIVFFGGVSLMSGYFSLFGII